MLTFMKNVKKFVDLKSENKKFHALHYTDGRVYASNPYMMVWIDGAFGKGGSYDFLTGAELDAEMPDFAKVIPPVKDTSAYAIYSAAEIEELHTFLKGVVAMSAKRKDPLSVQLEWEPVIMAFKVREPKLQIQYDAASYAKNHPHDEHEKACANVKLLADIVGYFAQRKTEVRMYAPLRVSLQTPILFTAEGTVAVLSQRRDMTIYKSD